jgi:uncharacterized protein (TIGR03437 family)
MSRLRCRAWLCAALACFLLSCAPRKPVTQGAAPVNAAPPPNARRPYPATGVPAGARLRAWQQLEAMEDAQPFHHATAAAGTAVNPLQWVPIGPTPILQSTYSVSPWSGHVNSLATDPRNSNVVYGAADAGGVWKTTDGGNTWAPLTDFQPGLTTAMVALDPFNPDAIYASTGSGLSWSGDFGCGDGVGILKSTDAGNTWAPLPGNVTGQGAGRTLTAANIGSFAFDPSQSGRMLAVIGGCGVVTAGLYRSTDGGVTWVLAKSGYANSTVFDATGQYAYAGFYGGLVYRSSDGGATWTPINGGGANSIPTAVGTDAAGFVFLAVAPSSPGTVLVSVGRASDNTLMGLYLSPDRGQTWKKLVNAPGYCGTQCGYSPALAFLPTDANVIFAGGLYIYRSLDGGASWTDITLGSNGTYLHSDHHWLAFSKDGSTLYLPNDAGVWKTSNPTAAASPAWTNLNATLGITEFYPGLSISPVDVNYSLGGTQDNGTPLYSGGNWAYALCGDGGQTAIDPATPSTVYAVCIANFIGQPPGQIYKSTSAGQAGSWQIMNSGIAVERLNWVSPLTLDAANPSRLYYGTYRVYQSVDGAAHWTPISGDLTGGVTATQSGVLTALAVSADSNTVYAGSNDGHLSVTNNANAGAGAIWTDRSAGLPKWYVTSIAPDPTDPQTAYVTFSTFGPGHVFKTSNQGKTWTDISGNLPAIPANDLAVDPDLPGTLYLGTDLGVFRSTDQKTWAPLGSGLPHVIVTNVKLHRASRTLRAGTYGRSVWDLGVPATTPRLLSASPAVLKTNLPQTVTLTGANFDSGCTVSVNGTNHAGAFVNATTFSVSLAAAEVAAPGSLSIAVLRSGPGGGLTNPLTLAVNGPLINTSAGIISGASFQAGVVSGGWTTIRGTGLSATTRSWSASDFNGANLPTSLDGVSVSIDGRPAYVYYISQTQLNVLAPGDSTTGNVQVQVTNSQGVSNTVTVSKRALAPELFTFSQQNGKYAAATDGPEYLGPVNLLGTALATRPARPGEIITLYGTGLGPTNPPYPEGATFAGAPPLAGKLQVTIGGVSAAVSFAGLVAPGEYQINVQVPASLPNGDAAVVLNVDGTASAASVFITVGQPALTVTSFFVAPTSATAGQEVSQTVVVKNQGNAPAGPFRVGFYFSTTWDVQPADLAQQVFTGWSCNSTATLAPNQSYTCTGKLGIPSDIAPGLWFAIAYADDLHQVPEATSNSQIRVADNGATTIAHP